MTDKSITSLQIIKDFLLNSEKEEITLFFHPDNDDGIIDVVYENGDFEADLYLPDLATMVSKHNLDTYDIERYYLFKNHIKSILSILEKENIFSKRNLLVYTQHIDGEKEVILNAEIKKRTLFPSPQQYSFNLSMVHQNRERKWWKVVAPIWQEDRPFQNLELSPNARKDMDFYSWLGTSIHHLDIKKIKLISEQKIKKLWDYESSDLDEVFSDRFCQMLIQIGVKNIEFYPIELTCKATGETNSSYYRFANIVGLIEGIYFYKKSDFERGIDTIVRSNRVSERVNAVLKAKKETLYSIKEKIIRCKECPELFIVDNDIKEACEVNDITGIEFEELRFLN